MSKGQVDFEKLIYTLRLTPIQARELYMHRDMYDLSRLEMRGDVLFAPRRQGFFARIFDGASGDVIGAHRVFLRGARRVKILRDGYYMGHVGKWVYYGAPDGRAISPDVFKAVSRD